MPLSPSALVTVLKAMPELREILRKEFDSVREAQDAAFDVNSHIVSEGLMAKVKLNVDKKKWMIDLDELSYQPSMSQIKQMVVLSPEEKELIRKGIIPSVVYTAAYKRLMEQVKTNETVLGTTNYRPILTKEVGIIFATDRQERIQEYMKEVMPFMLNISMGKELAVVNWSRTSGLLPLIRNMQDPKTGGKQPLKIENEQDVEDFLNRRGKYGRFGWTKGTIALFVTLNGNEERPDFVIADFDIEGEDPLSDEIIDIVQKSANILQTKKLSPQIMFTGNGWHIVSKNNWNYIYDTVKNILIDTAKEVGIPSGVLGSKGKGISLDYASSSYRRPWRFPLSIHPKTGYAALFIKPNEMSIVDELANPEYVLKTLHPHTNRITSFFLG